jgi:branched-chain amino acid transport system ATP-binding protein
MTVLRNVTLAPRAVLGRSRAEAEARATELLTRFGLADKRDEYPDRLSGGQQQRAAIARALAMEPELMLLDEPTAGMGHEDVDRVRDLIKEVAAGRTVLMVEHNMSVVSGICDTITVLQRGSVLAEGSYAEVSANPAVMEAYMGTAHG